MITKLDSDKDYVLAVEVANEYDPEDVEKCREWMEEKLNRGIEKINFLVKVDKLPLTHISCKAFWADGVYAIRHLKNMGHLAFVGHSRLEKVLVGMDGAVFNRMSKGLKEHYFDVEDMDKAWEFVNEKP